MLSDVFFKVGVDFAGLDAGFFPLLSGDPLELGGLLSRRIRDLAGFFAGIISELLRLLGRRFLELLGALLRALGRIFTSCFPQVVGRLLDGWTLFGMLLFLCKGFAHCSGWLWWASGRQGGRKPLNAVTVP